MISNAQIVPLLSKPLTRLLLLLGQTLSRSFSNRENHVRCFPSLYQSLRREWSIIDMQITWYCPIVNSATWTCSFQPPVHAFRELMNKNASPPRKNREKYLYANLQLCEALGLELYNIRYYPSFLFFFFHVWYSCQKLKIHIFKNFHRKIYCFHHGKYQQSAHGH